MFSREFYEVFKNTFLTEQLRVIAFALKEVKNDVIIARKDFVTIHEEAKGIMVKQTLYKVNLPNFW